MEAPKQLAQYYMMVTCKWRLAALLCFLKTHAHQKVQIRSQYITAHWNALYQIISHHITSDNITPYHIASDQIRSDQSSSHHRSRINCPSGQSTYDGAYMLLRLLHPAITLWWHYSLSPYSPLPYISIYAGDGVFLHLWLCWLPRPVVPRDGVAPGPRCRHRRTDRWEHTESLSIPLHLPLSYALTLSFPSFILSISLLLNLISLLLLSSLTPTLYSFIIFN